MQTQTTGAIRPDSIDFSHRLYDRNGKTNIGSSVELIASRAEAVHGIVMTLCTTDPDEDGRTHISRINSDLICFSLESVRKDIKDIAALVNATSENQIAAGVVGGAA